VTTTPAISDTQMTWNSWPNSTAATGSAVMRPR
jgi:hypothetical protein